MGIFIEDRIIIVVIILALGTDGIAIAATVTNNLQHQIKHIYNHMMFTIVS